MLYLFYGTKTLESAQKAKKLVNSLRAKRPDAAYEEMNADNWNAEVLQGHLGGQGLFSSKYIVFLDRIGEKEESAVELMGFIPSLQESENIFIALEGKLKADLKKVYEKSAEKVVVSDEKTAAFPKKEFNIFSLADAFGSRNSAKSLIIFREAILAGHEPEAIVGTLFWQAKSIALASDAKSATEAGLSPFVWSKAKRYSENFSRDELQSLLSSLITIYHDSHRGLSDLELSTERFLLGIKNH